MRRALIVLDLLENAVLSQQGATEGAHRSLPFVPGAALLGVAAARYDAFGADAWRVFHSGDVRFSNAIPLSNKTGRPLFPMPQSLMAPKHHEFRAKDGALDRNVVRVHPFNAQGIQYEALPKESWISPLGECVAADLGRRLRTATEYGRAKTSALFEYAHVPAGARFVATIEDDSDAGASWDELRRAFDGAVVHVGRSKRTEYGRARASWIAIVGQDDPLWPGVPGRAPPGAPPAQELTLWTLSDLAVVDRRGMPTLRPSLRDLFGAGAPDIAMDAAASVVSGRRWAPWSGVLNRRDIERSVISQGSVLVFATDWRPVCSDRAPPGAHSSDDATKSAPGGARSSAGLWREQGLGRLWIDPPLPPFDSEHGAQIESLLREVKKEPPRAAPQGSKTGLVQALERRAAQRRSQKGRDALETIKAELAILYRTARRSSRDARGPSRSHWSRVATAVRDKATLAEIRAEIESWFEGDARKVHEKTWLAQGFLGGKPVTFKDWLRDAALSKAGVLNDYEARLVLDGLAQYGRQLAAKQDEVAVTQDEKR